MTHTATPWDVSGTRDINGKYLHIGSANSPMVLASMNAVHVDTEDNAAFIVKAVNSHEALVKALQAVLPSLRGLAYTSIHADQLVETCEAALKQAGA